MTSPHGSDEFWMQIALQEARAAAAMGEVPVGAVVVKDGSAISHGHNAPIRSSDPTAHAEVVALRSAAEVLGNYRLDGCTLYVTLEPCVMCAGAIFHSRISRVVYGAKEPKTGSAGSALDLFACPTLNHQTHIVGGVLADECRNLVSNFFLQRRQHARQIRMLNPVLRDDALRTPDTVFEGYDLTPTGCSAYVSDLPGLAGLRMHYWERKGQDDGVAWLCLHSLSNWSYIYSGLLDEFPKTDRVIAIDLIGFGRSDKPKRRYFHALDKHQKILSEFVDRLKMDRIFLVLDQWENGLGFLISRLLGARVEGIFVIGRGFQHIDSERQNFFNSLPFVNKGYRAAPEAMSEILENNPVDLVFNDLTSVFPKLRFLGKFLNEGVARDRHADFDVSTINVNFLEVNRLTDVRAVVG